jgi:transposase
MNKPMAKLSAELRSRAQKELLAGIKPSEVAKKFNISPSACSYLKQQATGSNPGVAAFEAEFSKEQRNRLERLLLAGESINDLAKDYETSKAVLVAYCNKHKLLLTGGVIKLPASQSKKIKVLNAKNKRRK